MGQEGQKGLDLLISEVRVYRACLDSPFFSSLSVHGLHFTVCAPSNLEPAEEGSNFPSGRFCVCAGPGLPQGPFLENDFHHKLFVFLMGVT